MGTHRGGSWRMCGLLAVVVAVGGAGCEEKKAAAPPTRGGDVARPKGDPAPKDPDRGPASVGSEPDEVPMTSGPGDGPAEGPGEKAKPPLPGSVAGGPGRVTPTGKGFEMGVWYATTRARGAVDEPGKAFLNERDPAGKLHYGRCVVFIPFERELGSLGSSLWKRTLTGVDDRIKLRGVQDMTPEQCVVAINAALGKIPMDRRDAMIFVHGYNTSFEGAAIRAAQLGFDLRVPGVTGFFSWPSKATETEYSPDEASVETAETQLADFLEKMVKEAGIRKVHVIAHSMGNRALARAAQELKYRAAVRGAGGSGDGGGVRFGHIVLAAPDVDSQKFGQLATAYAALAERTTMYVSARDKALYGSLWKHSYPRAGYTPPITVVKGIDTIEITDADVTMLGHSDYAEAGPVLLDIASVMWQGKGPEERPNLVKQETPGGAYWRLVLTPEK